MTDTSGPSSTILSASAALQSALASRLAASLPSPGGMLYRTTFKHRATPSQQQIPAWRSTAARTSDSDCTGWPSPTSGDAKSRDYQRSRPAGVMSLCLPGVAKLTNDSTTEIVNREMGLAGWPTPRQADGEKNVRSAAGSASEMERKGGPQDMSMAVSLCGWSTPMANDSERRGQVAPSEKTLNNNAALAGWPTPRAADTTGAGQSGEGGPNLRTVATLPYGPIRYTVHGEMLTGSSARMGAGGQLSPVLPCWLMAFPEEWQHSAPGWRSWSIWQDLMAAALEMQSDTG